MLPTEAGKVRPASCRDKGRSGVDEGAWCLSSSQKDSLDSLIPAGSHHMPTNHVATRTSTRPNTVQICAMARSILLILALPYTLRFSLFEQYCPQGVSLHWAVSSMKCSS